MTSPTRRLASVLAVGALALGASACSEEVPERDPSPVSDESEATDPATPSPTETPTADPSETAPEGSETALPVYFAGDSGAGTRLFREFVRGNGGDALTEAARIVDGGGQPADPDYRTLWPGGTIASVEASDGLLVVRLEGDAFTEAPDGMRAKDATMALQQLVYTLQGVQQERIPVQFVRDSGPARLFGIDVSAPVRHANALRVLNLASITSPEEGATVTGDTLTVTGVANSFEASGPCRLLAGNQEIALVGYQSAGWMGQKLFPFEVELPLAGADPGELVVQCETDDPSGGTEGFGPFVDTKTVILE